MAAHRPELVLAAAESSDACLLEKFQHAGCLLIEKTGRSLSRSRRCFLDLERIFGPIRPDDTTGEGWYPVCPKGEDSDPRFLADTNGEFSLHTDQAFQPAPPDIMGLLCEAAASRGGESLIADAAALYDFILRRAGPERLADLFKPFYRLRRPPHELCRPLFFHTGADRTGIAYRGGDAAAEADYPEAYSATMALVEEFLAEPRNRLELTLMPGQILLLDNRRYLHGRRPFSGHRLLYRLHFRARPELARRLGFAGDQSVDRMVHSRL